MIEAPVLPKALAGTPIDGARLLQLLDELAAIGADERGGVTRPGLGPAEYAARQYLAAYATRAGLVPHLDEAGNLIVRRPGARPDVPVLLMGSHIDTVLNGGRLDGAYGVVAAIEVLRTLNDNDRPGRYEPAAVAFANEEGAQYPCPFFGSMALAGRPAVPVDEASRQQIRGALRQVGGDLDAIANAGWRPGSIGAYLELHIEQGPVLERYGLRIGVVQTITGRVIFDINVRGRQAHAGTTPMAMRRDALAASARLVLAIEDLAHRRGQFAVGTVGALTVQPGVTNVIPGVVRMSAEIRDTDAARLADGEAAVLAEVARVAAETRVAIDVHPSMRVAPVHTAPELRDAIIASAAELALPYRLMPSGAGHDAQIVAEVTPIGMIFVPSRDGISHAPDEHSAPADLIAGAAVLLRTARRLCDR
jgi:N-carbamoyl-L-amino-acid hydrolase